MDNNNNNQQTQNTAGQDPNAQAQNIQAQQPQNIAAIDYEKLSQLIAGKQSVTEETVLKGYFKQQGLSKEEMDQAIHTFKQQKAANQPDVGALQSQAENAQKIALNAQIENKALLMHQELGVELNTIPYLMKLADLQDVAAQDGSVDEEKLKEAFTKVLADVPQLKVQPEHTTQGFRQIGAAHTNAGNEPTGQEAKPTATKRWNRFN